MIFKMAAPFRLTVEFAKSRVKLCCKQFQQRFTGKTAYNNKYASHADVNFGPRNAFSSVSGSYCPKCKLVANPNNFSGLKVNLASASWWNPRYYCTCSLKDRKCWQCGSDTSDKKELFFCNCGVVQEVPSDLNYFEAVGSEETFDIDIEELSRLYKNLQRRLHPDKYSQKSEEEQAVADRQSAYVNKAYTTLLRPLSRGLYMLEQHGEPIDEANTSVDPEFLMLMMEINEELSEHQHDVAVVKKIERQNADSLQKCINSISDAFRNKDITEAKALVVKLKYYTNIEEKIKEIHRYKMDRWTL